MSLDSLHKEVCISFVQKHSEYINGVFNTCDESKCERGSAYQMCEIQGDQVNTCLIHFYKRCVSKVTLLANISRLFILNIANFLDQTVNPPFLRGALTSLSVA